MSTATAIDDPATKPGKRKERSVLLPREHGAYAQIALPLFTGLSLGRPTLAGACLTVAAVAAFLAHEPWMVSTGQRGGRALRASGELAREALARCVGVFALAGGAGVLLAGGATRTAALACAAFGAACAFATARRWEKSGGGELLVASACASLAALVASACGVSLAKGCLAALSWSVIFAGQTLAVRGVIARTKQPGAVGEAIAAPALVALGGAAVVLAARAFSLPAWLALALVPAGLVAVGVGVRPPGAKRLRGVGWSLVASSVVALAVVLAALR